MLCYWLKCKKLLDSINYKAMNLVNYQVTRFRVMVLDSGNYLVLYIMYALPNLSRGHYYTDLANLLLDPTLNWHLLIFSG